MGKISNHRFHVVIATCFISFAIFFVLMQIHFFGGLQFPNNLRSSSTLTLSTPQSESNKAADHENIHTNKNEYEYDSYQKHKVAVLLDFNHVQDYIQKPRIAIIIPVHIGHPTPTIPYIEKSISSILSTIPTNDQSRILSITILYDEGIDSGEDADRENSIHQAIEKYKIPIKVLFSKNELNRAVHESVLNVKRLLKTMENRGLKSKYEDITLLFMKSGSRIVTDGWLDIVTDALMGSSFEVENEEEIEVIKPLNAISFALEESTFGQTYSFNMKNVSKVETILSKAELENSTLTLSYPTPVLEGTVTAMKLNTYLLLPVRDKLLCSMKSIELEMSFNLWRCGDGIDILPDLRVESPDYINNNTNIYYKDARKRHSRFFSSTNRLENTWIKTGRKVSELAADMNESKATYVQYMKNELSEHSKRGVIPSVEYCRDLTWYMENVNAFNDTYFNELHNIKSDVIENISSSNSIDTDGDGENNTTIKEEDKDEVSSGILPNKPLDYTKKTLISRVTPINLEHNPRKREVKTEEELSEIDQEDHGHHGHHHRERKEELGGIDHKDDRHHRRKTEKEMRENMMQKHRHPHGMEIFGKKATDGIPVTYAIDENGNDNYVHNSTSLRRNPPEFKLTNLESVCSIQDETWKLLTEKVSIDFEGHEEAESKAHNISEEGSSVKRRATIMCIVYTMKENSNRVQVIRETWGQKCDGFMAASNNSDKSLDMVAVQHNGRDTYREIWYKVQAIWSYVYDNYYDMYDWFHIGGDDLYLLVENLRLYLESEEIQLLSNGGTYLPSGEEKTQYPLSLGLPFLEQGDQNQPFNTGGSGYTLNKAALKALVTEAPSRTLSRPSSAEDLLVSQALRETTNYVPIDTADEEGHQRYHHLKPETLYNFHAAEHRGEEDWYTNFSASKIREGLDCCSRRSVAFHYIDPDLMKRMHAILYGYCKDINLKERMLVPHGL